MKLNVDVKLNIKSAMVKKLVEEATRLGLRDTIVVMAEDALELSPVLTGNNMRSICYGVAGLGHTQASGGGRKESDTWTGPDKSLLDESKLQAALYSTSGYGGYLETGTSKMAAQPYIVPSVELHKDELAPNIKRELEALE